MDSIRDLSSHLPRRRHEHPQELLSDFKAAALSVTNLYKSADAAQKKSRAAGYQDALDDLLAFLDKEDIGLMDGEGWRIRQWATARLDDDGSGQRQQQAPTSDTEGDAEKDEEDTNTRSSSPEVQRKMNVSASSDPSEDATEQRRVVSEPPAAQLQQQQQQRAGTPTSAPRTEFTFRSNQSYPSNHDRESGMELDNSTAASTPSATSTTGEPPIRVVSRPNRARHAHRHRESGNRAANGPTINFNLGSGAGNKRKIPYPDFFDISGIDFNQDNRRDGRGGNSGGGGGKRGRFV